MTEWHVTPETYQQVMAEADFSNGGTVFFADGVYELRQTPIGATRDCPDCGRPQHYTGTERGWCHDALIDTWHCADPRTWHPGKVNS